ncbi:SET domain-containing protein 3 [Rhizina undulata]
MTENPTITLRTPGPSQPPSLANSTATPDEADDSAGEIDCICEIQEDDGYTICCDHCRTWQHFACLAIAKDNVPAEWFCTKCRPRPVDVQKAKDLQRQRQEQARKSHKKKRTTTSSHKKKESNSNGTNGTSKTNTEKTTAQALGKPPSPREGPPTTSRKRAHRGSVAYSNDTTGANVGSAASPAHAIFSDRNGDGESDTDFERPSKQYKYEYTDITAGPDRYSNEIRPYIIAMVQSLSNPITSPHNEDIKRYSPEAFESIAFPKISVHSLPDSFKQYHEHRWYLKIDGACAKGKPVAVYRGEIGLQEAYKKDSINQYSQYNHPKAHVLFHPNLEIYIDGRRWGSDARFARRSCRPNLSVHTIVVENSGIHFGLYAAECLKPGSEITVGWDFSGSPEARRIIKNGFNLQGITLAELKEAARWAETLTGKMGNCACIGGNDCYLIKLKKIGGLDDSSSAKQPITNGNGRKQRPRRNTSTESNASGLSKEPSPDRMWIDGVDEDDDTRSVSVASSKGKPNSRDLTPSNVQDTAVEAAEMTGREARKFQDVINRIQKQEMEEQQNPTSSNKRRKRNSTVSLPLSGNSQSLSGAETKDGTKGTEGKKSKSAKRSLPLPGIAVDANHIREYSVTDASVGRRASNSPISSDERRQRRTGSNSPAASSGVSKSRSKTIVKPPRPQYVDSLMQTDPIIEEPWWPSSPQVPPRPPRIPLRKRLMQSLLKDQEAIASTKKRKFDEKSLKSPDASPMPIPKSPRLTAVDSSSTSSPIPKEKPSIENPSIASPHPEEKPSTSPLPTIHPVDPNIIKPSPPPSRQGPSLENLFNDAVPNGFQPIALHLMPAISLPSTLQSLTIQTPTSATFAQSPVSGTGNNPSPVKTTKKMTLSDYGKRKYKAESTDKPEDKATTGRVDSVDASIVSPTTSKSSSMEEPRKLPEVTTSTLVSPVMSALQTDVHQNRIVVDSRVVVPKEPRAATTKTWGLR